MWKRDFCYFAISADCSLLWKQWQIIIRMYLLWDFSLFPFCWNHIYGSLQIFAWISLRVTLSKRSIDILLFMPKKDKNKCKRWKGNNHSPVFPQLFYGKVSLKSMRIVFLLTSPRYIFRPRKKTVRAYGSLLIWDFFQFLFFFFNKKLSIKDPRFFLCLASVRSLIEEAWLGSCPCSTTALSQCKQPSRCQRGWLDTSRLPQGPSRGPRHRTGKDVTLLGLGRRDICSNQAGWSVAGLLAVELRGAEAGTGTGTASHLCGQQREVSHTAWVPGRRQRCVSDLMPMPRATGTTGCTRLVGSDFSEVTFRPCTVWGFTTITCEITSLIERYHFQISSHTNTPAFYLLGSNHWSDNSQTFCFVREMPWPGFNMPGHGEMAPTPGKSF